jgi:hypothetical protein
VAAWYVNGLGRNPVSKAVEGEATERSVHNAKPAAPLEVLLVWVGAGSTEHPKAG